MDAKGSDSTEPFVWRAKGSNSTEPFVWRAKGYDNTEPFVWRAKGSESTTLSSLYGELWVVTAQSPLYGC